ncbi:MAG: NAD-dependent epimerase/dehydratase family protein [candidate division Zixibacteria bacterium]|nr:NAD-dependent epimerase/dehydratase family protein [candidate division Zixibacteria bacterium]
MQRIFSLHNSLNSELTKPELKNHYTTGDGRGKNVLLTGGTGFVGDLIIKRYLERTDCALWIISRPRGNISAKERILNRIDIQYHNRIKILEGELGRRVDDKGIDINAYMGLDDKNNKNNYDKFRQMVEVVDEVFHNGSYLGLKNDAVERGRCMDINILGTQRIFNIISLFKRPLKALFYTSTAFVHGIMSEPQEFGEDTAFPGRWLNPYEESKWRAEILIRNSGYPFRIFRPGVIAKEIDTPVLSSHTIYGVANVIESGYYNYRKKNPEKPVHIVLEGESGSAHNIMLRSDLVDMIFDIRESDHGMNHVYNTVNTHNTLLSDVLYAILYNLEPGMTYQFVPRYSEGHIKNIIEEYIHKMVMPIYKGYLFKSSPEHRMDNVIKALGEDYLSDNITKINRETLVKLMKDHFEKKKPKNGLSRSCHT